ncbi:MAG: hypothetical protein Q9207_001406 [Kuettlingeria erythrocarpa]
MVLVVTFKYGRTADGSIPKDPAPSTLAKKGTATDQNLVVAAQRDEDRGQYRAWRALALGKLCVARTLFSPNLYLSLWAAACEKYKATIYKPPESVRQTSFTNTNEGIFEEERGGNYNTAGSGWQKEKKEEEEKGRRAYIYSLQHKTPHGAIPSGYPAPVPADTSPITALTTDLPPKPAQSSPVDEDDEEEQAEYIEWIMVKYPSKKKQLQEAFEKINDGAYDLRALQEWKNNKMNAYQWKALHIPAGIATIIARDVRVFHRQRHRAHRPQTKPSPAQPSSKLSPPKKLSRFAPRLPGGRVRLNESQITRQDSSVDEDEHYKAEYDLPGAEDYDEE